MPETPQEAYDRGAIAGQIAAKLAEHDEHLDRINGSMEKVASELHHVNLALQRLSDQFDASARTAVTTAAALKEADEVRRASTEQRWSPIQKLLAVLAGAVGVVGVVTAVWLAVRTQ